MIRVVTPAAWAVSVPRVVAGFAPPGTVTLERLADPRTLERVAFEVGRALGTDRRAAVLTVVHFAVGAITAVLAAPLVLDGVALEARPDQLGVVLRDGELAGFWVAEAREGSGARPMVRLGAIASVLLAPIASAVRSVERIGLRGLDNVMLDALAAGIRRHERMAGREPDPALVEQLVLGAGREGYRPARPLSVHVDAGPAVTFHVPATCCVLATEVTPGACPTCPMRADDTARRIAIIDWVDGMDDPAFREVCGRDPVRPGHRSPVEPAP
ncbi:MAG: hypothetical protein U0869_22590 [Chloroflexota bacterium]